MGTIKAMSSSTPKAAIPSPKIAPRVDEEATVADLIAILRRRRMIIVMTVVLVTIPSALFGILREPSYTAVAQVVIETQPSPANGAGESGPDPARIQPNLETQTSLIRSHPMIVQTMEDLNLFDDPELAFAEGWQPGQEVGFWNSVGAKFTALGRGIRSLWSAADNNQANADRSKTETSLEAKARRVIWKVFDNSLNVTNLENSYVIEVSFTSSDANKAAAIANHLAELYVQRRLQGKIDAARKLSQWTFRRLQTQQRSVLTAERSAAQLRSERQFAAGRGAILTQAEIEELDRKLSRTIADKAKLEAKLAGIGKLQAGGRGLDAIAETAASPAVTQLRLRQTELMRSIAKSTATYGEGDSRTLAMQKELADVSSRMDDEIDRIVRALRDEHDAMSAQAASLGQLLQAAKDKNVKDNEAALGLLELDRDIAAKRTVYEDLLKRYQETRGLQETIEAGARVISMAEVPASPSSLAAANIAAVGFVMSALLGCGLALLLEQADKKLRSRRQIERGLGVPCLGLVPIVENLEQGFAQHDYLRRNPRSAYAQSIRGIYAQLDAAAPKAAVVLVTSALPGEGKTRLAADIAMCAALEGQRTVLVDFDDYRPMVARSFGLKAHASAGLLSAKGESASNLDKALIVDEATGIDILAIGSRERMLMPPMRYRQIEALLMELRKRYDRIVVDSPPLLGVSDSHVLSTFADAVVIAVRWAWTDRAAAAAGLRILRGLSANVAGVILTQVDFTALSRFDEGDGLQYRRNFKEYHVE